MHFLDRPIWENLAQFVVVFDSSVDSHFNYKMRKPLLCALLPALKSILERLKENGFQNQNAALQFRLACLQMGYHKTGSTKDIISVFESEIENFEKIDRSESDASLSKAMVFCICMEGVFRELTLTAVPRLRVVQ